MSNFIKTQNSFAQGEVAPEFYLKNDINGLSRLENMDVLSGGIIRRRPGLMLVERLHANMRLIPFTADDGADYLLALGDRHMYVYRDSVRVFDLLIPWADTDLPKLQYAQRFGTMIFVHPDYKPMVLKKNGLLFSIANFVFASNPDMSSNMPFMRFEDSDGISITVTTNDNGNNYATFTTNADFWTSQSVGTLIRMLGKQWSVITYINARTVVVYVNGGYTIPQSPVYDWTESAFGANRGWPCSITFYQDRLVFGGSRSYPSGVWMSHVGDHGNFDVGTGLDDEAIFLTLVSEKWQQICTVVSGENLQILTDVGEWAISNNPLTPSSVNIKQHTSVGSVATRFLPPQKIEGATVFVSASGTDIRELDLDDFSENYSATDLCLMAKHLMKSPTDIAYNDTTKQLFLVMSSGQMSVLNINSAAGTAAWARYVTNGTFESVSSVNGQTFVVVCRDGVYYLERFDNAALSDAGNNAFSFVASALPMRVSGHNAANIRVNKVCVRVMDTQALYINNVRAILPNDALDDLSNGYTGDVSVNLLGHIRNNTTTPLWRIHGSDSKPLTVMSVTVYGYFTV